MKIKEVMGKIKDRDVPYVSGQSEINEVIQVIVRFPRTRLVYVVDDLRRLRGTITVGSLLRHIFPYHYKGKIHPRGILRNITAEKAEHIMDKENIYALPEETVDTVLKRMAASGVKEMAVVDPDGIILTDITAVDLLRFYHLER